LGFGHLTFKRSEKEFMPSIKEKLINNELVVGPFISEVRNPNIAYLLAQAGFDFFVLDNEHGTYSYENIANIIAAARGAGIEVIVRIPEIARETILKPLDSGADGLLIPQVNTAEQAIEVVNFSKYPPEGDRGLALRRAHSRYAHVSAADYLKKANEEILIVVQIESKQAVENADKISAVEGVDCVFVGPFDLSVSLGIPGDINHPREVAAIDHVFEACKINNKPTGILMFDQKLLTSWIQKGVRFAAYSSDISMLADSAAKSVAELKKTKL
jgi:2-keto-3-deoxy-L-rhamnonate aldolase RhmA